MDLRISYNVDGYKIEEIINTTYDHITPSILENISSLFVFNENVTLYGNDAFLFLKNLIDKNSLLLLS